jgi:hypothetical protein
LAAGSAPFPALAASSGFVTASLAVAPSLAAREARPGLLNRGIRMRGICLPSGMGES